MEIKFKLGTGFSSKTAGTIYFDRVAHEIYVGDNLIAGDIFWATYGVTSYADITGALNKGKTVLVKRSVDNNTEIYTYAYKSGANIHSFTYISGDTIYRVSVSSDNGTTWIYTTTTLENVANKVTALSTSSTNTEYPSAKGVYDEVHPEPQNAIPAGGMLPNVFYNLGEISSDTTMSMANPVSGIYNEYMFQFSIGSTVPNITWDSKITAWLWGQTPVIEANKSYEVSVVNGLAILASF